MAEVDPDNEATYKVCVIKSALGQARIPKRAILKELRRCKFCEQAIFAVKLALEEALINAVMHGNRGDSSKTVTVRYAVNTEQAVILVRDEGGGFAPDEIPDPTTPDRLRLPNGRGIMLMRAYMDDVRFRDNGREVRFMKRRKQPGRSP
jgi:serine/threonine-protein kinase RsbW